MTRRTLTGWACAGLIALSSPLAAKPPGLPALPVTDGTAPTPQEQDHFRPATAVAPKLLPAAIRESQPTKYDPPTAVGALAASLVPFDAPLRLVSAVSATGIVPGDDGGQNGGPRSARTVVTMFGNTQTVEPPFAAKAIVAPDLAGLQLNVLREAARQYREAVTAGDKPLIEQTAKMLDAVLKQTKNN